MARSPEYPDLLWMPPRSYTPGRKAGQPTKIVIHYTAGREGYGNTDIDGAHYCQIRTDGTSAHYFIDGDSCTQCVRTTDESHTALAHGNDDGIHYELCGTVQTRAQWMDKTSLDTLKVAAKQIARDMQKYGIPLRRLVNRQVRDRDAKGICGHVDMTYGWPEDNGTHTDPGPQFPWDILFAYIQAALNGEEDDDMAVGDDIYRLLHDGKRPGPESGQTSGGGIPVAWIVRKMGELQTAQALLLQEVDGAEEALSGLTTIVLAIQAGDVDELANALAAKLNPELLTGLVEALNRTRLHVGE